MRSAQQVKWFSNDNPKSWESLAECYVWSSGMQSAALERAKGPLLVVVRQVGQVALQPFFFLDLDICFAKKSAMVHR